MAPTCILLQSSLGQRQRELDFMSPSLVLCFPSARLNFRLFLCWPGNNSPFFSLPMKSAVMALTWPGVASPMELCCYLELSPGPLLDPLAGHGSHPTLWATCLPDLEPGVLNLLLLPPDTRHTCVHAHTPTTYTTHAYRTHIYTTYKHRTHTKHTRHTHAQHRHNRHTSIPIIHTHNTYTTYTHTYTHPIFLCVL